MSSLYFDGTKREPSFPFAEPTPTSIPFIVSLGLFPRNCFQTSEMPLSSGTSCFPTSTQLFTRAAPATQEASSARSGSTSQMIQTVIKSKTNFALVKTSLSKSCLMKVKVSTIKTKLGRFLHKPKHRFIFQLINNGYR